jgi:aryl-phospho-beta-D-glucosidase BglC (GH1 family)
MKRFQILLSLLALSIQVALTQPTGFVTTKGKEIVGSDGKPLFLRGINLGNWLVPEGYMFKFDSATSPRKIDEVLKQLVGPEETDKFWKQFRDNYITAKDINYIKKLGMNSVRVPFNWRLFMVEGETDVLSSPGFEMLDRVIKWCRDANIWVILDMHCAPGGQTGDNIDDSYGYPFLFESEQAQHRTIAIWKKIAERYHGERIVIGYDLLNEPIPHFFDQKKLNPLLEPLYKRIVSEIRRVDKNHIVFLGGAQWDTNFGVFGSPFDSKLVYTWHKYWCDTTQAMVQEYVDFREKYNVPIWLGETGENTDEWIGSFRRLAERNTIGWCYWPYKKMDSPRGIVTFDRPEEWETIKRFAEGPRATFQDVRTSRPSIDTVRKALKDFLELCKFDYCRPNKGYIEALGLQFTQ